MTTETKMACLAEPKEILSNSPSVFGAGEDQDDDSDGNMSSHDSTSEDEAPLEVNEEEQKPRKITARRRADNDQFEQWLRDKQETCSPSALTDKQKDPAARNIISSPREYQVELFERAKKKNIIAVLDTGSGKTLIAALLVRHTIEQELVDRSESQPRRISFFLVDKVSLVFQQWKVLNANLDHPVKMFCGDLLDSRATREFWKEQFENSEVIVCTAAILLDCLHHSYIRMDQINLMVFDEAHHAKKNHPYARIIKDFYADLEKSGGRKPRILGMTASPVDAKTDYVQAAAQLEGLLHSEIATIQDPQLMKKVSSADTRTEIIIEYPKAPEAFETLLWKQLYVLIGKNAVFKKLLVFSAACTRELGRWCADRVWQLCLTEEESWRAKAKTERDLLSRAEQSIFLIDSNTRAVTDAFQLVQNHAFGEAECKLGSVSVKVAALIKALQKHFNPVVDKCIIFVEQRLTAILLTDLLKQPGMGLVGFSPGALLGSGSSDAGDRLSMTYREQQNAVKAFRTGELNCLVATSIAEEGLDIPDCNMIIRFDLYNTMIQYIQSKGRARMQNSKYLHMVEFGAHEQSQRVFDNQENEERLKAFCRTLPEDRYLKGNDYNMEYFLAKEKGKRAYTVPGTGARLDYPSSLVILATFVASLEHPADVVLRADYIVRGVGSEFQCEVILPDTSPIKNALGRRAGSKQVAKCSAAYEMCLQLRKKRYIDEYLRPIFTDKKLPAMRNARLAISSKKRAEYTLRIKPEIWSRRGFPEELFITVLKLSSPEALGRPSRPLAILTREQLPNVADFPLFFGNKNSSVVNCIPMASAMPVSSSDVQALNEFTLRILKDVFSKEYKSEPDKLPFYFAPLAIDHSYNFENPANIRDFIDWGCAGSLQLTGDLEWEGKPDDIFKDRYVTDPHDGSRKFYTLGRREDLKPSDPQLPDAPKGQGNTRARRDAANDIWNYSVSLWSKSRAFIEVQHDLPVIEAEYIPLRRNLLDEFEKADDERNRCYLVFATMKMSALPVDIVAMAYNLPAIIHRLESNLIVLEACHGLGLDIRPDLALEAMTKDSDNTDEHTEVQINFQKGMGDNYERLEFLGDSFLKMSTTIALYTNIPEGNEFDYHVERMILICNKNLFNNALELKLEKSIRSKSFNRRTWYPEGLELLKGKQNTSIKGKKGAGRAAHVLADKSIADVCEALIGAAYLTTYDKKNFDMAVQAVTKFTNRKNHTMMAYNDFYAGYKVPDWQRTEPTAFHRQLAKQIELGLGYTFKYPRLLRCAFTHPSYSFMYEHIPHYQRLEFLGDALLDMVCVDYLFQRYPGADPQWLTEHKMAMVSNQFLGCLCVSLGFHKHLVSMTGDLQQQISSYVDAITKAKVEAEREAESANLTRAAYARDFWVSVMDPPKCLPDIVESYMGAVFVDSEYDYNQVQRFFEKYMLPYFEDMHIYDTYANKHPITFMTNRLQMDFHCANWRIMVNEMAAPGEAPGETHVVAAIMLHGKVHAHAARASGRYAKTVAAKEMTKILDGMSIEEFKKCFGCDCTPDEVADAQRLRQTAAV